MIFFPIQESGKLTVMLLSVLSYIYNGTNSCSRKSQWLEGCLIFGFPHRETEARSKCTSERKEDRGIRRDGQTRKED